MLSLALFLSENLRCRRFEQLNSVTVYGRDSLFWYLTARSIFLPLIHSPKLIKRRNKTKLVSFYSLYTTKYVTWYINGPTVFH